MLDRTSMLHKLTKALYYATPAHHTCNKGNQLGFHASGALPLKVRIIKVELQNTHSVPLPRFPPHQVARFTAKTTNPKTK